VKQDADGQLELLGRIDFQVKIRGYRIELGEIESALRRCSDVKGAIVVAREDALGRKQLVGYIVADEGLLGEQKRWVQELKQLLPEYMIPAAFVVLESFPLTPNGKVDRKAFPAPDGGGGDAQQYEEPSTPAEELLATIWKELLKLERVGIHDNFFELGGHSLLAAQLIARIRKSFAVDLAYRAVFQTPTIAGIAEALVQQVGSREMLDEIVATVLKVEQLSEENAASLLQELRGQLEGSDSTGFSQPSTKQKD
jgi:acyl carrier protein